MKTLPEEEKKLFIEKHFGKEMFFKEYYKYKFYYEFVDENGKLYTLACGDVDCDIEQYRNPGRRFSTNYRDRPSSRYVQNRCERYR